MIPGRGAGWVRWEGAVGAVGIWVFARGGALGAVGRGLGPLEGAVGAAGIWVFRGVAALGAVRRGGDGRSFSWVAAVGE